MGNDYKDNDILRQQEDFYDSYAKIKNNPRYLKSWQYIRDHVPLPAKLLDVGCTNGDFSVRLLNEGFDCYGLEANDKGIADATKNGIKVTKGSFLERFPFEDASFDVIFAGEVIEHTIQDDEFLSELYRVLTPGGILIITTPNLVSLGNRILMSFGCLPRFAYSEFHYRIYTPALIREKILSAGFSVEGRDGSYVLISRFFSSLIGPLGELLGTAFPNLAEHIIIYARKKK
jgi:2-polyprenyl-3-methyl-5-hydroxy-6-metoxy-1,4-benzoquinol methylase